MDWYNSLNKPLLNPPSEIFMPVWGVMYTLIALSLIAFLIGGISKEKIKGLICFGIQLVLNFAWSGVFFGMKNIGAALAIIILMWLFIILTIIFFYKHSKIAAVLLIPYLLWVTFALYLNIGFFVLN